MGLCVDMTTLSPLSQLQDILCVPATDKQPQSGPRLHLPQRDNSTLLGRQVAGFSHKVGQGHVAIHCKEKWVTTVLKSVLPLSGRPCVPGPSSPSIPCMDSRRLLANV